MAWPTARWRAVAAVVAAPAAALAETVAPKQEAYSLSTTKTSIDQEFDDLFK